MNPPNGWGDFLVQQAGLQPYKIPLVIVSAIVMYGALVLVLRVFGGRTLSATSVSAAAVAMMLGSVAARALLGPNPTVAAGLIALVTLGLMEALFHGIERSRARRLVSAQPVLVFWAGRPLDEALKRTRTSPEDLDSAMRRAGIAHPVEVQCIVMEPHGGYSVVRVGQELSPELYRHVEGVQDRLPEESRAEGDSTA